MRRTTTDLLLAGARQILGHRSFEDAAYALIDACKRALEAGVGFLILYPDGLANEPRVFVDSGGESTPAVSAPTMERLARAWISEEPTAVIENHFDESEWSAVVPTDHVSLRNLLTAPLFDEDRPIGLLGLANCPHNFTDDDTQIAVAFAVYATIALRNSRVMKELERSQLKIQRVAEAALDAIIVLDSHGSVSSWNPAAERIFGYSEDEMRGRNLHGTLAPAAYREAYLKGLERFRATGEGAAIGRTLELQGIRKDGVAFPMSLSLSAMRIDGEWHAVGVARDISELKEAERRLEHLARRDPLTGVYNRHALTEIIEQEVRRSKRYRHPVGLLMIDVNRFKEVNDRFGHAMGDRVLIAVSEILCNQIRESDIVVRYGGDEFLVVLLQTNGETDIVARRIVEEVDLRNETNPLLEFPVTLAIGAAHWDPETDDSIEAVLAHADRLMYEDKAREAAARHRAADEKGRTPVDIDAARDSA